MVIPDALPNDSIADAALAAARAVPGPIVCDACDAVIDGEAAGSGLYVFCRGEELRIEEPPLCARCATAIGVTARELWDVEEEEG